MLISKDYAGFGILGLLPSAHLAMGLDWPVDQPFALLPVQTLQWPRCPSAQQLLHLMLVLLRASFCTRAISPEDLKNAPFSLDFTVQIYQCGSLQHIFASIDL